MGQRALCLIERGLVRLWVDHHDGFALLYFLALGELHRQKFAADSRLYRHAHVRSHRAQRLKENRHRLLLGGYHLHRHRTPLQRCRLVCGSGIGFLMILVDPPHNQAQDGSEDEVHNNPYPRPFAARWSCFASSRQVSFAGSWQMSLSGVLYRHGVASSRFLLDSAHRQGGDFQGVTSAIPAPDSTL